MKTFRDLLRDYRFAVGLAVVSILVVLAVMSFFSPVDPTVWFTAPRDLRPSWQHVLGTNSKGQDMFWQATFGIRNSLIISLIAGSISRVIAVLVGMVAGYRGGATDRILMFLSDTFLVIPLFLILVMLAMLVRKYMNLATLGLLLAIFGWAWDARDFTRTARLCGTKTVPLVLKEYMPFATPLVFSTFINNMAWAIGLEMTLAIMGLTNLDIPTLGTMLQWAISYQAIMLGLWGWLLTPVVLAVLLFIALYWMSVSVSEYLDPRSRVQRVGA
jgi:peptide/nickel transport system permease protein